jgi:Ca2+-binding RTX toxin-like protein
MPDIVVARLRADAAHGQVFDHAPAQRADGLVAHRGPPVSSNDLVDGGPGNDRLIGGSDDDELLGGDGIDRLEGRNGDDLLFGDRGDDTLEGDRDADQLFGNRGDDLLLGGRGDDLLDGGPGDDLLDGGPGADDLRGDRGNDRLTGDNGADRFIVANGEDGIDRITDFDASDTLVLSELLADAGLPGAPTGASLDTFLQFGFDGADTDIAVDVDGAADFADPDVTLVAEGVDLVGPAPSQAAVIDGLLTTGQLEVI